MKNAAAFIKELPKAELHMHLEGSIEPERMMEMAKRNNLAFPYASADELRAAYDFTDLQSFLKVLYAGYEVLQTEQDFYDMTVDYLTCAHTEKVLRAEVFFNPQGYLSRGIPFEVGINGVLRGLEDARRSLGISADVIIGILRHRSTEEAFEVFELVRPYRDKILGVGLGGSERGNPPSKFEEVFGKFRDLGWHAVAHAGEEGSSEYIWEALKALRVDRVDHGVRCVEDPTLVKYLAEHQVPLTVCPLSNVKLKVFPTMKDHNFKRLMDLGLRVTINSDDPTQFDGYVNQNFEACADAQALTDVDLVTLAKNSFLSAFVSSSEKTRYCNLVDAYHHSANSA